MDDEPMPRGLTGEPSEVWEWSHPMSWLVITSDVVDSELPGVHDVLVNSKSENGDYWQKLDW